MGEQFVHVGALEDLDGYITADVVADFGDERQRSGLTG